MKKYVSVLLAVLMIFTMSALSSCGEKAPANALEMIEEANGNLKQNGADVRISLNATTKASAVDVTVSAKITVQVSGICDGRISRDTEAYVYADFGDLGGLTALAGGKTESTFVEIALSGGILYMRSRLPSYEEAETQAIKADISGYFGVINEAIDKYSSGDFADGSDTTESLSAVSSVIDGIRERLEGIEVRSEPGGYTASYSVTEEDEASLKEEIRTLLSAADGSELLGIYDEIESMLDSFGIDAFMFSVSTDRNLNYRSASVNGKASVEYMIDMSFGGSVKINFTDPGKKPSVKMPEGHEDFEEIPAEELFGTVDSLREQLGLSSPQ